MKMLDRYKRITEISAAEVWPKDSTDVVRTRNGAMACETGSARG